MKVWPNMDDPKLLSHDSSIPLIARLDHLEFIMKFLERKQRCGGSNVVIAEKSSSDSSSAVKDDFFKGTLLDRVASLEHRLSQVNSNHSQFHSISIVFH